MVQFIEKHRRLLQAYCLIARILGWLLILGGIFWLIAIVKDFQSNVENIQVKADFWNIVLPCFGAYLASSFVYDFFTPGILAFAIAGLLDYLLRPKTRPPLILGMMDKLCYLYVVILILKACIGYQWLVRFLVTPEMSESTRILLVQPLLGPTVAKVLLLIGVGMILHRLLPVIEESKTLV
jgi:fructose-specific phosphotransferase system IIC component